MPYLWSASLLPLYIYIIYLCMKWNHWLPPENSQNSRVVVCVCVFFSFLSSIWHFRERSNTHKYAYIHCILHVCEYKIFFFIFILSLLWLYFLFAYSYKYCTCACMFACRAENKTTELSIEDHMTEDRACRFKIELKNILNKNILISNNINSSEKTWFACNFLLD